VTDSSEQELLEQARAGDRSAFNSLEQRLQAQMRRFIRRLIGSSREEEDILRDAFLALYLNLERISVAEGLRPFLFRVLRNLCYSELRRKGRKARFAFVSLDTDGNTIALRDLPEQAPPPHERVLWRLFYEKVQKAMERLPELQRQTLLLYLEEDLTYQQIAEVMSTNTSTVKSRLHEARQNLIRHLKPDIAEILGIHKE